MPRSTRKSSSYIMKVQEVKPMKYHGIVYGIFSKRINRFIAEVMIHDRLERVHVKNTGRLKELLVKGAKVALEPSNNSNRRTKFSLTAVWRDEKWINIDSQAPNKVVYEALKNGKINEIGFVDLLKREVTYGKSRFDIYYEREGQKGFMEVKGVTLEKDGIAMFPDAPTTRGTKHVLEMMDVVQNGYEGTIFFLVQMEGCHTFTPHSEMDMDFAEALKLANQKGVQMVAYETKVTEKTLKIGNQLPIEL
ncbi:DNA/RNA nuclease SfsA [Oceanobacillus salinisoli]|uniref:DNA/RNA nuclease SfsA n=1 Tax=Oceanobacillus salinisoli TaxID=2678611 RepID=UPI001E5447D2|nr:DNA/RNA nuclease SfsA [Oceanobacillus salinisoli]